MIVISLYGSLQRCEVSTGSHHVNVYVWLSVTSCREHSPTWLAVWCPGHQPPPQPVPGLPGYRPRPAATVRASRGRAISRARQRDAALSQAGFAGPGAWPAIRAGLSGVGLSVIMGAAAVSSPRPGLGRRDAPPRLRGTGGLWPSWEGSSWENRPRRSAPSSRAGQEAS